MELAPISAQHPLSKTSHFVAGLTVLECDALAGECAFEVLYASFGVAIMSTVVDGDCGLDVMTLMLGKGSSFSFRRDLRMELSDYLIARVGELWLHDIMVACQELRLEDVQAYRSGVPPPSASLSQPHQRPQSRIWQWERPSRRMLQSPRRRNIGRHALGEQTDG